MRHSKWFLFVCGLLTIAALMVPGKAWSQTATINVNVSDATGAVMAGVQVTVTNTDTGATSTYVTDNAGLAVAPALPPGNYKVSAAANGFGTQAQALTLTVGLVAPVRFTMTPASTTQTVEVKQDVGLEIETTKVDVSGVVSRQQLDQLPVINRGFIGLAQLLPGGSPSLPGDARFGIQTTFGGANVRSGYSVLVDGADLDHPIYGLAIVDIDQDAVQEFRVNHNQYDAQYGRAGTAVVDVVTRSGTNAYAGMFSYFGQNQALNARNFYVNTAQPPFSETYTSATFGGPIIKDKLHFFVSDEYLKQANTDVEALPSSNPFASTYNGVYPGGLDEKLVQGKIDDQINATNSFSSRYLFEDYDQFNAYQFFQGYTITFHDDINTWVHIFSPSVINSAQLEYMDQNTYRNDHASGPEIIRPSFTSGQPPNLPQGYPRHRAAANDTFYWTKGRNTMKAGTRLAYERLYQEGDFYGAGVWTFNTNTAFPSSCTGEPSNPSCAGLFPISLTIGSGASTVLYRNAELSFFFQDDVKLARRVTLNLGVRYDAETNLRSDRFVDKMLDATYVNSSNVVSPVYPGLSNFVSKGRGNDLLNVQPRLGLAWDLKGDGRTVLRMGFGGAAARNRPFFNTQMMAQDSNGEVTVTNAAALSNYPNVSATLGGLSISQYIIQNGNRAMYLVGNHLNIPYVYDMDIGVEKALLRDTVLTVDGVRQIQTFLQSARDMNLPATAPGTSSPLVRPNPEYAAVSEFNGTTSAYYTALDAQLKSRFRKASFLASYSWSKSISDGLDDNTSSVSDPFHAYGNNDRGFDEEDRRSDLSFSPLVELPWNFEISGILSLMSGNPFNITYGKDFDGDKVTQDRPAGLTKDIGGRARPADLAIINAARTSMTSTTLPSGLVIPSLQPTTCLNGSAPSTCLGPVTLTQLNAGNGIEKMDVRLTKGFNFGERYRAEMFMEAYDITNTPGFQPPNAVISSPDFLQRNTANNPRQMQWGARFIFGAH